MRKYILRKGAEQSRDKCTLAEMKIYRTTWKWLYCKYTWDHQEKGKFNTQSKEREILKQKWSELKTKWDMKQMS